MPLSIKVRKYYFYLVIWLRLVTVTRKGQVTIPEDVRRRLDIKEGSKLLVENVDEELVIMKKIEMMKSLEELQKYCQRLAKEKGLTMDEISKEVKKVRSEIWKEKYEKSYG